MKRQVRFRMAAATLAWSLMIGSVVPIAAYADGDNTAAVVQNVVQQTSLGSVGLAGGSSIELKQASVLASDEGKVASFTLTFRNTTNYEIQFIDYWVRLLNKGGTSFTVQVLPQDKDKNGIAPHSSQDINMYAKVSGDTDLDDLIFRMVKWDFSSPNYEQMLGDITIPADYSGTTPADHARIVTISGVDVKMASTKMDLGQNSEYYLPKIRFRLDNAGVKTVELPVYQYALRTQEGLLYPLQVKGLEENNRSLYPRFNKELELTGKLPLSVGAEGWELVVTNQIDGGNNAKLSLPVAFFALPAPASFDDHSVTPVDGVKNVDVGTETLETSVKEINRTKRDASYGVALTYAMKNTGTGSVTLPAYRFAIQTSEGLTYPAKAEGIKDMVIDPLFTKETQLTAIIPSSVSPADWKLLLLPPVGADGVTSETALAVYKLSDSAAEQGGIGKTYNFTTEDGTYTTLLNGMQRLPWEDEDIISANLTVANNGTASLPLPAFNGYFLLDDIVKVPATAIVKDSVISVKAGSKVNLQLYGKIPYTNEYSRIKLVLQEKEGDAAATDLLEFSSDSYIPPMPVVLFGNTFRTEGAGRQASISIRDVIIYEDEDSDLYSIRVKVQNLEKRYTALGNYVAYVKSADNTMYPATIREVKSKISPDGMAVLNITSYLPKTANTPDLQLILGAGVKEGKLSSSAESDAYIDAVSFKLPIDSQATKGRPLDLDLYPYLFTITNVATKNESDHFNLNVKYKFTKNQLAVANTDGHRVIVEMEDKQHNIKLSKTFTVNKEGSGDNLVLGENNFVLEGPSLADWQVKVEKYTLRVYDEFEGNKKLLSETEVDYFSGYTTLPSQ
ncbi:MAG: hypothetical protein K0R57_6277 [Paenibacillaceae bacterium]|jgi:hypothetical protein|nr:hypothetical protein [Paenibacillaceae bacterium]